MVSAALEALREQRAALLQADSSRLAAALEEQARTAQAAGGLQDARNKLRMAIAQTLGVPAAQATMRLVADAASASAGTQLTDRHRRLTKIAGEVESLTRANSNLIRSSLDLLTRVLTSLTGGVERGSRYSQSGRLEDGGCGHLFETQG